MAPWTLKASWTCACNFPSPCGRQQHIYQWQKHIILSEWEGKTKQSSPCRDWKLSQQCLLMPGPSARTKRFCPLFWLILEGFKDYFYPIDDTGSVMKSNWWVPKYYFKVLTPISYLFWTEKRVEFRSSFPILVGSITHCSKIDGFQRTLEGRS